MNRTASIVIGIGLLLAAGVASAQSASGLAAASVGEPVPLTAEVPDPLTASVSGARYAMSWPAVDPRSALTGDEKLVIVSLTLRNDGDGVFALSTRTLDVQVLDRAGRGHDKVAGLRIAGRSESAESNLLPGVSMNLDVGVIVPGSAEAIAVAVRDQRSNRGPGVRVDVPVAASLPRSLSPDGITVTASVDAGTGVWYPLGATDVRVEGIARTSEPLLRVRPDEDEEVAVASLTVRNRSSQELRLHAGLFRDSALAITDGERKPLLLLLETRDEVADFALLPGAEAAVRMVFEIPADAAARRLDLVEHVGARSGALSRRYLVALGAPTGSGLIGVTPDPEHMASGPGATPPLTLEGAAQTLPELTGRPDPATLPGTLSGTEAGPVILPQETILLETVGIPEVMYVVRLDSFRVEDAQEGSGDEPWLIVMQFQGRIGDTSVPSATRSRRSFLGSVDWGESGRERSLAGNPLQRTEYTRVRPYEISGLVIFLLEGDESSDGERERLMRYLHSRTNQVWNSEISRRLGLDYNDFRPVNRDRIVQEFERFATNVEGGIVDIKGNARENFDWSSGDSDEIMDVRSTFWINVDDAANPGVRPVNGGQSIGSSPSGRDPAVFPTDELFYRRFFGTEGHSANPLHIGSAPGSIRSLLRFQITKEQTYSQ